MTSVVRDGVLGLICTLKALSTLTGAIVPVVILFMRTVLGILICPVVIDKSIVKWLCDASELDVHASPLWFKVVGEI